MRFCGGITGQTAAKAARRAAALLLAAVLLVGQPVLDDAAFAADAAAQSAAGTTAQSTAAAQTTTAAADTQPAGGATEAPAQSIAVLTGTLVFLDDGSAAAAASRPTPALHLYANGTDTGAAAVLTDTACPFAGASFTAQTYTFENQPAADANGTAIVYTVRDTGFTAQTAAAAGRTLFFADAAAHTPVAPDADGGCPAGTMLLYDVRAAVSGVYAADKTAADTSAVTLTAVPANAADAAFAQPDAAAAVTLTAAGGSWSVSGLAMYSPTDGTAVRYRVTAAGPARYAFAYDNTAAGSADVTDAALAGGTIRASLAPQTVTAQGGGTEGTEPVSVTVTNTTYNYAAEDTTTFTADADVTVTIGGTTQAYAAGEPFTVPQNASFTVSAAAAVTLTLDTAASGCVCLGSAAQALTADTTFYSQKTLTNVELQKRWLDGALADKPADGMALALDFSTDGGATWTQLTADNMAQFGYTALPALPEKAAASNDGTWAYDFISALYGWLRTDDTAAPQQAVYRLHETAVPAAYTASYVSDGTTPDALLVNTLKKPIAAEKVWMDGSNRYTSRPDFAAWLAGVKLYRSSINSTAPAAVPLSATDASAEGYITVTASGDSWSLSLPNTLAFDPDGFPYSYFLQEPDTLAVKDGASVPAGTVYTPVYYNAGNYASIASGLYDGGVLTNTLTNTEQFTATKVWKDDGSAATIAARPTASITLYRYPESVPNYESASPVPGDTTAVLSSAATEAITITLPADGTALPMFNESGYRYIYFVKEKLSGGSNSYAQVFVNNGTRDGNDKFLFSGGELDNTITGTVTVKATKKWTAAARQDVDANVVITLTQTDPSTGAVDTSRTATLTGFGTENSQQTATFTVPKYNAEGLPYQYSADETALQTKVNGAFAAARLEVVNGVRYAVTADGYRYRMTTAPDGNGDLVVTNTLVGDAQVVIQKIFPDGLLVSPTTAVYTVYRNGTAIGTVTKTYEGALNTAFTPDPIVISSYEEMDAGSYGTASGTLPRYDSTGAQYTYTISETSVNGGYGVVTDNGASEETLTSGAHSGEKYLRAAGRVVNSKPGSGIAVTVRKTWKDAGETLYRLPVHAALQYTADGTTWQTLGEGTIAVTTDYTRITMPKAYEDAYRAWNTAGAPDSGAGAFRVVETALGTNAVQDDSAALQAQYPEHNAGSSFVSTPNQNYDVSPLAAHTGSTFTLTNTRVGTVHVVLTKTWVDGANAGNTRPDSVTFTVTAGAAVFSGSTTKTYVLDAADADAQDASIWRLTTEWFPKYDASGAVIPYKAEETSLDFTAGQTNHYTSAGGRTGYTVGARHTGDEAAYAYTNTLAGTVYPLMNKYWKDLGDAATIAARPDIYPVLIRSWTDAQGVVQTEKMTYQDRDWNTRKINSNWWQCAFVGQPRYTADGREYTYYVAEEYSSAKHGDYVCSGGYADAPDTATGTFSEFDAGGAQKALVSVTVGGKTYYASRLDNDSGIAGTIVNRPTDKRTVSGTKVWTKLPAGFDKQYLPDVTFHLMRYTADQQPADAQPVTDAQGAPAATTLISGENAFSFAGTYPRYDNEGKPYNYIVSEASPDNIEYTFKIVNSLVNGLVVTNEYKQNQTYNVTFTKQWSGFPAGMTAGLPSVKVTLVRYLTDATGAAIAGTREAAFAAAPTNTSANTVTLTYANAASQTAVWTSLAYYGPNTRPYLYRVEETGTAAGTTVYAADGTTRLTANTAGAYEAPVTGTFDNAAGTGSGSAALTNRYGEVLGSVKLAKTWAAGDTAWNVTPRPADVSVQLMRASAAAGTEPAGAPVVLNAANSWTASVDGLELYAPNGDKYTYSAAETVPTGYTVTYSPLNAAASSTAPVTLTATNTPVQRTLTVKKAWADTGTAAVQLSAERLLFLNGIGGAPKTLTYRVAYSTDGGTSWALLTKADGSAETLTVTQASGAYADKTAQYPAWALVNGEAKAVQYRAFEYAVTYENGVTRTRASETDLSDTAVLGFVSAAGTTAAASGADASTLTNSVVLRPITITKVWNDEQNRDNLRAALTFTVTRTGIENASDTAAATVKLTASDAVQGDADRWSKTVYVPVHWNTWTPADAADTQLSSYAVAETSGLNTRYTCETGTDGTSWTAGTAVSLAGGADAAAAYFRNTQARENIVITPKKAWTYRGVTYPAAGKTVPVWLQDYLSLNEKHLVFELQYRTSATAAWTAVPNAADPAFAGVTAQHTGTIDPATGTVTVEGWTVPRYVYTGVVSTHGTYSYRIVELPAADQSAVFAAPTYSTAAAGISGAAAADSNAVTVTNALAVTSLPIVKTWDDVNNACNTRPDSITCSVQVSTDGTNWSSVSADYIAANPVTLTKASGYKLTVPNLPAKTAAGVSYQYRAVETSLNYAGGVQVTPGEDTVYRITAASGGAITNKLYGTSFTVTKQWGEDPFNIGADVTGVQLKLQNSTDGTVWNDVKNADGSTRLITLPRTASGIDTMTLTVPAVESDAAGTLYTHYRAVETGIVLKNGTVVAAVPDDASGASGTAGGFTYTSLTTNTTAAHSTVLTNTVITTSFTARKAWSDDSNVRATRPAALTFHLVRSGTQLAAAYDRTLTDPWDDVTWDALPKMDAAGNVFVYTVAESAPGYTAAAAAASGTVPYTVTNTAIPVTIAKTAADGTTPLAGAHFTLAGDFTDGTSTKNWDSALTPAVFTGLLRQSSGSDTYIYTLTETVPPAGCTLPANAVLYLRLDAGGALSFSTTKTGTYTAVANNAFVMKDPAAVLKLAKQTAAGGALAGASFTVEGRFAVSASPISWTGAAKTLTGELIAGETYVIREQTPPQGYTMLSGPVTVTMGSDGRLTPVGTLPAGVTVGWDAQAKAATVTAKDSPTVLAAEKRAATGTAPVAGAVYTVTALTGTFADGTAAARTLTTLGGSTPVQLTGQLVVSDDETNTYQIVETTPPAGYVLPDPADARTVRVTTQGKLQQKENGTWTDVADNKLIFRDAASAATLEKRAAGSSTALAGAVYTLSGTFADGSTQKTLTSGTAALALTGQLVAGGTYTLRETTPAPGYVQSALTASYADAALTGGAMTLRLGNTGTLSYANTQGGWTTVADNALVLQDAPNALTLAKQDADGTPAAATFTATGIFAGDTAASTKTLVNNAAQGALNAQCIAGNSYLISETVPPAGHKAAADFTVRMNADGTLSFVGAQPANVTLTGSVLTVQDARNSLTVTKHDQFGRAVAGAQLALYSGSVQLAAWNTTDENPKTLTGLVTAGETCTLREESAPGGYTAAQDVVLRMTADGRLQQRSGTLLNYTWTDVAGNAVTLTDTLSLTQVQLKKTDGTGAALAGTTFSLYKKGAAGAADTLILAGIQPAVTVVGGDALWSTSGAAAGVLNPDTGLALNKGLANGDYYFLETDAPAGYYLDGAHHAFTASHTSAGTTQNVTVVDPAMTASLRLVKVDAVTGAAIPATQSQRTTFTLTRPDGTSASVTTNESGILSVQNLARGSYTLTETTADSSYENGGFACTFTVTDNCQGKVLVIRTDSGTNADLFDLHITSDAAHVTAAGLANERQTGAVAIEKLDGTGAALAGAQFTLYDANGGTAASGTTGTNGTLTLSGLAWGSYELVETAAPAGFARDATRRPVTIGYGALHVDFTSQSANGAISNSPTSFGLQKKDGTGAALAGAQFTCEGTLADGSTSQSFTAGTVQWAGRLVAGSTYTIRETQAPAGYAKLDAFRVTMSDTGVLTAAAGTTLPDGVSIRDNTILVKNTLILRELSFKKLVSGYETGYANAADVPAAGVTFTAYTDAGCTTPYTFLDPVTGKQYGATAVSDKDGTVTFSGLRVGTYYLKETAVPGAMTKPDTVWTVTVDANGGVSKLTPVAGGAAADTVTDDVVRGQFAMRKVSMTDGTTPLAGAVYNLYRLMSDDMLRDTYAGGTAGGGPGARVLVATATTDANGALSFSGLLTGVPYVIEEVSSPAGSQVSVGTVSLTLQARTDGTADIQTFDGGSGTVTVDANGNYTWHEPPTKLRVEKVDESKRPLIGAVLHITDDAGNIVVPDWTTDGNPKDVTGLLTAGKQYTLVEVRAPAGYNRAASITFTVEAKRVGSTQAAVENAVQLIRMTDHRTPDPESGSGGNGSTAHTAQTGDAGAPLSALIGLLGSGGVLCALRGRAKRRTGRRAEKRGQK